MPKALTIAILSIIIIGLIIGVGLYMRPRPTGVVPEPDLIIILWEQGEAKPIADIWSLSKEREIGNFLIETLQKINFQARCVLNEEDIQEVTRDNKVLEVFFRPAVLADFTINQWIDLQDRDHIPTNEEGYRILGNVENVIFILEDNSRGLEGHILICSEDGFWGCWAIKDEAKGEIDTTWIQWVLNELENE